VKQDYLQMRVLELAPQVYVTGQVFETDLKMIAGQGVRSIMNNRPDGEVGGQPKSADLASAAVELGMTYVHVPVDSRAITEQNVVEFGEVCDTLERPLLIFCRSGARSTRLWEICEARGAGQA
jgi:sulfide:quinone oxidoreductase